MPLTTDGILTEQFLSVFYKQQRDINNTKPLMDTGLLQFTTTSATFNV